MVDTVALEGSDMEDPFWYYKMDMDKPFVTTKRAIEDYLLHMMCEYLNGLPDGIYDEYRYDESDWDKALDWVMEYIGKCIADLKSQ